MEDNRDRNEIYSKRVRAGKRTYFFDIKSTKSNDYYLTITESKKKYKEDGFFYEKHKVFLYKEDLEKFTEALDEAVNHIKTELLPDYDFSNTDSEYNSDSEETQSTPKEPSSTSSDEVPSADSDSSDLKWD